MNIDFSETFPHLPRAPIVEAVIDLRAKPSVPWDQEAFQKRLKEKLPDYPTAQQLRQFQGQLTAEAGKLPEHRVVDIGWTGLQFWSKDQHNVAKFEKDGFAFSRLEPYQNWKAFEEEALRLWKAYVELTLPDVIQRIGVRFINRMLFPNDGFRLEDYLIGSPQPLASLGLARGWFLHQDALRLPETSYMVNLIRTMQPAEGTPAKVPLILDIDVFIYEPMDLDEAPLKKRLVEMQWLKNRVFFDSITPKTKGIFT
ncbi:MAG: TIGR04255 family protein [Candidatus Brocadiia bacterium]|jgi:uncharacterized protein (TIGR04255 family)